MRILAIIKDSNADIVHINSRVLYPLVPVLRLAHKRIVFHIHELFENEGSFYVTFIKICMRLSDMIIFPSMASMRSIKKSVDKIGDNGRYKIIL